MKKKIILLFLILVSCSNSSRISTSQIINKSIKAHGWDQEDFSIVFDFRDYQYELKRKNKFYSFQRTTKKEGNVVKDLMSSKKKLKRFINNKSVELSDSMTNVFSNSLNSVMYFFQLPRPLKDQAVITKYLGLAKIFNEKYWTIKVTFKENGGGKDYQDEFRYWININNGQIDYLAYNYLTEGGGTRFRQAVNKQLNQGFIFQDYINFKPNIKFVSLDSLPILFEAGNLIKVSNIKNKNIRVSK
ncbi:MAG: hypothetical protein CMC03_02760 [Flavobacteriaceae bacterium]|nr:hypothetical protein [Flavobacteriaceae bacterium]